MDDPDQSTEETGQALVREYYRAIDAGDMDALRSVLADGFTQERGDRTLSGREEFVAFMGQKRPETDTEHVIDRVFDEREHHVAVQGRLLHGDGSLFFRFVDVFRVQERLAHLITYTNQGE